MNNLSASRNVENHDVDTLLTLDDRKTLQDKVYGFSFCLRIVLLLRLGLGIRVARIACPTEVGELVPRRLTLISETCSDLYFRTCSTGFLGFVRARRACGSYQFKVGRRHE